MKHEYSTIALIVIFGVLGIGIISSLTTTDVDEMCDDAFTFMYRNKTAWSCSKNGQSFNFSGGDLDYVDDITSVKGGSLDFKADTGVRMYPYGQTTTGFNVGNNSANTKVSISGLGSNYLLVEDYLEILTNKYLILDKNSSTMACNSTYEGAIYYDGGDKKHKGCNSSTWVDLY